MNKREKTRNNDEKEWKKQWNMMKTREKNKETLWKLEKHQWKMMKKREKTMKNDEKERANTEKW